jgi:hypothetical protein
MQVLSWLALTYAKESLEAIRCGDLVRHTTFLLPNSGTEQEIPADGHGYCDNVSRLISVKPYQPLPSSLMPSTALALLAIVSLVFWLLN